MASASIYNHPPHKTSCTLSARPVLLAEHLPLCILPGLLPDYILEVPTMVETASYGDPMLHPVVLTKSITSRSLDKYNPSIFWSESNYAYGWIPRYSPLDPAPAVLPGLDTLASRSIYAFAAKGVVLRSTISAEEPLFRAENDFSTSVPSHTTQPTPALITIHPTHHTTTPHHSPNQQNVVHYPQFASKKYPSLHLCISFSSFPSFPRTN